MRESILNPSAKVVKGFTAGVMPAFQGQLSESELNALIDDHAYQFNLNNAHKLILHKEVTEMLHECILFHLDHYNQRSKLIHKTDFFSENNYVQLAQHNAILNFKFEDLQYAQYNKNYCDEIIND